MNNLISIIIPTFNRAHTLPVSLESVMNQTADNWELIIIDDGSSDSTQNDLRIYLSDERIIYYFQKNLGVSAARNKGVELSQGDYLIFLDSDDRLFSGLISRLNEINIQYYDLVCWQVLKKIDRKSKIWKPKKLEKIYKNIRATFLAGSVCYKKEIFLQAGGFDPKMSFGENYELGIRIADLGKLKLKILHETFLVYNKQVQNQSSHFFYNKLNSSNYLLSRHKEKYKNDSYSLSRLKYQLAFLNEKSGKRREAFRFYREAWSLRPLYFKALLKTLWLSINLKNSD